MEKDRPECYLCGAPATTDDHVPPKGMFPKPRPINLIKVPACRMCNERTKLDDEYFRLIVAAGGNDSPQSHALLHQRIIPRMRKRPALIVKFLKSVRRTEVRSPGGIILGRAPVFAFDRARIQTVVDKIVRGLFFWHTKRRLGADCKVMDFLHNPPVDTSLRKLPLLNVGDGSVFSYRYHLPDPAKCESYWFLMFYNDTILFVTQTEPLPSQCH